MSEYTKNPYRIKLKELQGLVKEEQTKLEELINGLDPKKEAELPEEEQKQRKEEFRKELSKFRSNIKTLGQAVKEHRMNKRMSSFFQWNPTGPNRKQAREYRRRMK